MTNNFKILDQVVFEGCDDILTVLHSKTNGSVEVSRGDGLSFSVASDALTKVGDAKTKSTFDILRMYVVIDNSAPKGLGCNGGCHASYYAGEKFSNLPLQRTWKEMSGRNVTCSGSSEDIQTAIKLATEMGIEHFVFDEPDWKQSKGRPIAVAFAARYVFPEIFKSFPLFLSDIR